MSHGSDRASKGNLLDAARAVVTEQSEQAAKRRRSTPLARSRMALWLAIAGAGLILLLVEPEWLGGPRALPPETPQVAAASLRLSVLRERQRVEDFTRKHGRLPTSLAEAGSTGTTLRYEPRDSNKFIISGQAGDSLIILHSDVPFSDFLGNSLERLQNRGRR
jgi:hypothetical protein